MNDLREFFRISMGIVFLMFFVTIVVAVISPNTDTFVAVCAVVFLILGLAAITWCQLYTDGVLPDPPKYPIDV